MLRIMEKNTTLIQNYNAAKWVSEVGLFSTCQLVLAMPGENRETISETTEFLKYFCAQTKNPRASLTYIQSLPGTPVYEYARTKGFIGSTLQDEEKYLIKVSDKNASDINHFFNFTSESYLTVQSWSFFMQIDTIKHLTKSLDDIEVIATGDFLKEFIGTFLTKLFRRRNDTKFRMSHYCTKRYSPVFYFFRVPLVYFILILNSFKSFGFQVTFGRIIEHFRMFIQKMFSQTKEEVPGKHLRHILREISQPPITVSEINMEPLRRGR